MNKQTEFDETYSYNSEFESYNSEGEEVRPGLREAKRLGQSLGDDFYKLGSVLSQRVKIEVEQTLGDLRTKIVSGLSAALAVTYAVFWIFAAAAFWLSPAVPFEYSVTAIALVHIIAAGVLFYVAKKPPALDEHAQELIETSKKDIQAAMEVVSAKAHEIKEITKESLNPVNKVKRNPEAFVAGSFFVGVLIAALSGGSSKAARPTRGHKRTH